MAEATITLNGRGDLMVPISPEIMVRLGFPHSLTITAQHGTAIICTPSRSRWSNRQIKKFKARHGLT